MNEATGKPFLEAVLFDLDGVLADSELWWTQIDATLLAEHGIAYEGEHKEQVLGKSSVLALQFYRDTYNLRAEVEELALRRHQIAADFYARHIPLYDAAPQVLATVKAKGLRIGLASSTISQLVHPFLQQHHLADYFDGLATGELVTRGKPNPDIYLLAAQQVGAQPERCLVVEDAIAGITAGKSAGMTVVAIPDPRFVDVSIHRAAAHYTITRLEELPALLDREFRTPAL